MIINKKIEFTCREDNQQDAMQGPTQHYHVHWEFLPGEFHACATETVITFTFFFFFFGFLYVSF